MTAHHRDQLLGAAPEDRLQLAADRAQQAVHARPAVQGRLHPQQVDERERRRRQGRRSAGTRRASWTATGRRPGSTAATTSSSASPTRCRGRAQGSHEQRPKARRQRLADQRRVRRVQRHAVHRDGQRHGANTPSNTQTADMVGTFTDDRQHRRAGQVVRHDAFAQPTGVRFGNTTATSSTARADYNLDFSVFRMLPDGRASGVSSAKPGGNVLNHGRLRQPAGNITAGTSARSPASNGQLPGAADPPRPAVPVLADGYRVICKGAHAATSPVARRGFLRALCFRPSPAFVR